jgi:alpha-L-rhamnosidase
MNSFNHYAYGAVAEWFFSGMAGIRPCEDAPGFERLILAPRPDLRGDADIPAGQKRITSVDAVYDSVRVRIESRWHYEDGKFVWAFTVPDGVMAEIELPLPSGGERFMLSGIDFTAETLGGKQAGKTAQFTLNAGSYLVREC